MKYFLVLLSVTLLSACGTVTTLASNDDDISSHLKNNGTYCESLPRIYSGASYDMCLLHSNPDLKKSGPGASVYLLDTAASAISDTLVLPYSIYAQLRYSSVEIR